MKTIYYLGLSISFIAVLPLFSSCSSDDGPSVVPKEIVLSRAEEVANDGVNKFGIDFFNAYVCMKGKGRDENFAISPVTTAIVMSMVANASTQSSDIESALGCADIDELNSLMNKLLLYLPQNDEKSELMLNTSLWYQIGLQPVATFSDVIKNMYMSPLRGLDFTNEEAAAAEINRWTANNTDDMIDKIVNPQDLTMTHALFANALYFKSDWASPFDETLTKSEVFHGVKSDVNVPMMYQDIKLEFYAGDKFNAVRLPYYGNFEMVLMMPADGVSINDLASTFTISDYKAVVNRSKNYLVHLWMPKFAYSSLDKAKDALESMGIEMEGRNFERMAGIELTTDIRVINASSIEVDEKGTKAAVVTVANGMQAAVDIDAEGVVDFRVDSPFMYFINNKKTNSIIMAGLYVQP